MNLLNPVYNFSFLSVFVVVTIFLFFVLFIITHSKNKYKIPLSCSISAEIFSVLLYASLLLVKSDFAILLFYSLFFASKTWIFLSVFNFCINYTEFNFCKKITNPLFKILTVLDSISFFVNPFFKNCFSILQDFPFFTLEKHLFFYIHFALCIFYLLFSISLLIFKILKTPRNYKIKHILLFILCACVFICEILDYANNFKFNIFIPLFALFTVSVYYCTSFKIPQKLVLSTLMDFYKTVPIAVAFYNVRGKCIFINNEAKKIFDFSSAEKFRRNLVEQNRYANGFYYDNETINVGGKSFSCSIDYNEIKENKKKIGFSLIIKNRTEELNILFREHYSATRDSLTGIYNKEYFFKKVNERLKKDTKSKYLLLASDIKNFKLVNELFGRKKGDEILLKIADSLKTSALKDNIYGRISGDKFAILIKTENFKSQYFEEQLKKISNLIVSPSYKLKIYIGVAKVTDFSEPASTIYGKAALAIDSVSDEFLQRIVYYDKMVVNHFVEEKNMISEFEEAISENEFLIYMQPIFSKNQKCFGAESLVRWKSKSNGLLLPEYFESTLEKTGLLPKLDFYVWESVVKKIKEWELKNIFPKNFFIFIKVSSKDFYYINVAEEIISLVEKYNINPSSLIVEFSGNEFITEFKKLENEVQKLHKRGIKIAIDDFGKSISSVNFVNKIKADFIKINMTLFSNSKAENKNTKDNFEYKNPVVDFISRITKILNISVIAKRLENVEQINYLDSIGLKYFQTDEFCVPISTKQFEQRFLNL